MEVKIRKASHDDLESIVDMHLIAFPEYYLTRLGRRVVWGTYDQYFKSDLLFPLVATMDGKPVGFIAGTFPGGNMDSDFWQNTFYAVVWGLLCGLLRCDKVIWGGILDRVKRIPRALRVKFKSGGVRQSSPSASKPIGGWLVSIAVLPEARGKGVAKAMLNFFEQQEIKHGAKRIRLCAYKNNARALAFYEKSGFKRICEDKLLYTLEKTF